MFKKLFIVQIFFLTILSVFSAGPRDVYLMDPSFYKEVLFPGNRNLNAVWDIHSQGNYIYIPLCAEDPYVASVKLYRYDIRNGEKKLIFNADSFLGIDLFSGVLPQSKFHTAIRTMKNGNLFMVTHNTARGIYQPVWAIRNLRHDPTGFSSHAFIYDTKNEKFIGKGIPLPNTDFYYGQIDTELNVYYMCSLNTLKLYSLNLNTMKVSELGGQPCRIAIVVDDDHMVYSSDSKQRIWKWDPFKKTSTMTKLRMPHSPYKKEAQGSWIYGWKDADGWIYAVPQYDNRICRFDPKRGIMEDLGPGWREFPESPQSEMIFAPVKAKNGKIYYGVLNEHKPYYDGTEIIELDPETKKKRNLGTMKVSDGTLACVLGEGTLGEDGKIYWGDGNHGKRGGMMWVFDPSKIPENYKPKIKIKRNLRFTEDFEKIKTVKISPPPQTVWKFRPLVRYIKTNDKYKKNLYYERKYITGLSLSKVFPLFKNAVFDLIKTYKNEVFGISGGYKDFNLFELKKAKIVNLGKIPIKWEILNGNILAFAKERIFIAASNIYAYKKGEGIKLFKKLGGEDNAVAIAKDFSKDLLYVLTDPSNSLLILNIENGEIIKRIKLNGYVNSRWLIPTKNGVYGFESDANIYKIDFSGKKTYLKNDIPSLKGLEFITEITGAAYDGRDKIWVGTRQGYLFSINILNDKVFNYGKPGPYYLKGITLIGNRVYAFSGGDFGDTHLFEYSSENGFKDYGLVSDNLVNDCVGKDGKLIAGEFSSNSSLLLIKLNQ